MLSWGEIWDQRQALSSRVNNLVFDSEKRSIQSLVDNSQDTMDLEMRADAVTHGAVASGQGLKEAHKAVNQRYFPNLVKMGILEGHSKASTEFSNSCHDENGQFCEGTGIQSPMSNMLHKVWSSPEHRKGITLNKTSDVGTNDGPVIHTPSKEALDKAAKVAAERSSNKAADEEYNKPNSWGFSNADLDDEKQKITHLMKRGGRMGGFTDRVDAETRAAAVVQGRVAQKGEIKLGRSKAASRNWGALVALGILAK